MTADRNMRAITAIVVVILVLACALELRDIAHAGGVKIPALSIPFGGAILDNLIAVALAVGAAAALAGIRQLGFQLGLRWNGVRGPALRLLATAPCWIGLAAVLSGKR